MTNVKVNGNSLNENFSIESKTATKIIANSIRAFSFDVSKVFSLILSDANASATFAINFSLCNATLNGKGFNCAAPVADKDVLAYDAVSGTWKPRPASGLNYLGTFDASSNPGAGPAIQPAGAHIRFNTTENWSSTAIGSAISFRTPSNGTTSVPERMRIDHNGNVGIGTSAPAVNLHVAGNVDGDVSSYLMNADDTGTLSRSMFLFGTRTSGLRYGYLAHHGAGFVTSGPYKARTTVLSGNDTGGLNFNGNSQIGLWVSSGEKMKILANGNVGIGVTTPDDKLVVYNGTTTGRYTATGWTHSSDARLKHDIHTITSATEKILKLRGVDYLLNNDPTNERQLGFIAQEVEPHFPEVVKTDKDGYKSMVYANLLAPLVEAFKDLYKKVTDIFMTTEKNTRAIASVNLKVKKLEEENAAKTKEIAELKAYLCAKDPEAKICK